MPTTRRPGIPRLVAGSLDDVWALVDRFGDDAYDEVVSQRAHALQCAALAVDADAAPELVAAALLHDVGHLLALAAGRHDRRHEVIGARWLSGLLPDAVRDPIRLHVEAKRYLCATDPAYRRSLSAGSERSLVAQGGPLDPEEAERFGRRPGAEAAVALRRWDDRAKDLTAVVAPLDEYRSLVGALVEPRPT